MDHKISYCPSYQIYNCINICPIINSIHDHWYREGDDIVSDIQALSLDGEANDLGEEIPNGGLPKPKKKDKVGGYTQEWKHFNFCLGTVKVEMFTWNVFNYFCR